MNTFNKNLDLFGCMLALITMGIVGTQELRSQFIFSSLRNAALSIEKGEYIEPDGFKFALLSSSLLINFDNCDTVNINSGLSVLLGELDRSSMTRSYLKDFHYKILSDYFSHALKCSPADGNIWIRYALVEDAFSKNLEKVASMAALSIMLSPSDKRVSFARSELVRNSSESLKLLLSSENPVITGNPPGK